MTKGQMPARPVTSGGVRRHEDRLWVQRLHEEGGSIIPSALEPPEALIKSIDEFNRGLFFEAHETLEDLWRITPYPLRIFYHGIIKLAAGFHHVERRNRTGAVSLLNGALDCLVPFQPRYMGVVLAPLLDEAKGWLRMVEGVKESGWEGMKGVPRGTAIRSSWTSCGSWSVPTPGKSYT